VPQGSVRRCVVLEGNEERRWFERRVELPLYFFVLLSPSFVSSLFSVMCSFCTPSLLLHSLRYIDLLSFP